ncbi:uncharacterized protein LOC118411272 [Branchiostoma floridae]|uniref:Uncharacterized protein LOC118411272 n=1 Tax=Branchiostoma floridae TaxID=7739 RepID=A0A9J7KRY9_BRAFL|nr:uncharacterized protein LOC118411272 [Branchiostoma floridae]
MTETYCTLCRAPFSGAQAAKEHFVGKRHMKNLEKQRMMSPSTETWSTTRDGVKSKILSQSEEHEVQLTENHIANTHRVSRIFCELCKAPFSSVVAAAQHYAGKRHKKMVEKQEIISNLTGTGMMVAQSAFSTETDHLAPVEKTVPTTHDQQSSYAHDFDTCNVGSPNFYDADTCAIGSLNVDGINIYGFGTPSAHDVDAYATGGPNAHSVNTYAIGGPSTHGVDTNVIGFPSVDGVDTYAVGGPSAHGVDTYAIGPPSTRAHGVNTYAVESPSLHSLDAHAKGNPSAHGVDTSATGDTDHFEPSSSVVSQSFVEEDAYFCRTCSMPLSGPVPAKQHYSGRTHRKRSQAVSCSSQLASVLKKNGQDNIISSRKQVEQTAHGNYAFPSQSFLSETSFCSVCNVSLSGPQPAMQHYSGRVHKRKLELLRNEESPTNQLSRQTHPAHSIESEEEDTAGVMSIDVQEETKKRHEETQDTYVTGTILLFSAKLEEKCCLASKHSTDTGLNQSERRSALEHPMDQSKRRSASGGQIDQSEWVSASRGQMDQSEQRRTSQDQSSSSTVTSSPVVYWQTPASSQECRVHCRSVSELTSESPVQKLQPRTKMLSTSRLACNFQTEMAPTNKVERRNDSATLCVGQTTTNETPHLKPSMGSTPTCTVGLQSVAVSPVVSEQSPIPVAVQSLLVENEKSCEKTSLKTSPMLNNTAEGFNLEGDTTTDDKRFGHQRSQKENTLVSGTVSDDSFIGLGLNVSMSEQIAKNCQEMASARRKIEHFLNSRPASDAPRAPPSDRHSTATTAEREESPKHEPAELLTNTVPHEEHFFYCDICKLSVSGPKPLSDHNNGAKHKKKLKMLGLLNPESTCTASNSSAVNCTGSVAMGCCNIPAPLDSMTSVDNQMHSRDLDTCTKMSPRSTFSSMDYMKQLSEHIARTAEEKEELLSE